MLSDESFEQWCLRLALSEQTKALITRIRSSPPSRRVQSAAGNVSGRYPSQKMHCAIQFESHRNELAMIYQLEHDSAVLEYFDQPERIKLTYQGPRKRVGVWHTPDFFVLREDRAGWVECKMEEDLIRFAEQHSQRYVRAADGIWSCPPGEAEAECLGLFYRICSSREIDWIYQRNLRFLEDYLRPPHPVVLPEVTTAIRTIIMSQPGLRLLDLLHTLTQGSADDVYFLLVTGQIYVDLSSAPLADPGHVPVFLNREMAEASVSLCPSHPVLAPRAATFSLTEGSPLLWDGKVWTLLNLGETEVTLFSEEQRLIQNLPKKAFEAQLQLGKFTSVLSKPETEAQEEERNRLARAHPRHLEVATQRYLALSRSIHAPSSEQIPQRTLERWRARFRAAEAACGNGYAGLLPDWGNCGNRTPRLSDPAEELLETFISHHYETLKQPSKRAVYVLLAREAEQQQIPAPSYATFLRRIVRHSRHETARKRRGERAAAQEEPFYWELEQTTPRHGERPWELAHMDHTELDIELVSARTGRPLGKPWVTFMTDAFSRRLLSVYLTFDPPSYRSCMMAMRECVWRYGRLPQTIIADGGPDFRSTYFETLLAYYGSTKATRPWAKPRYGSVIERLFGTANTQFVYALLGNTQITKQARLVTKSIAPREQAVWTLGDLYAYLTVWAYDVYEQEIHPALGMTPRETFQVGLAVSGARTHRQLLYSDDFRFLSLATTRKQVALVEPGRGVKINYLYYWSDAFRPQQVERTHVPVRYDPFDIGAAYAYVESRWVQCRSEYYLQLQGHSERELLLASAELRKQYQHHAEVAAVTAKRLADFLADVSAHEEILLQRFHDLEARDILARMEGGKRGLEELQQEHLCQQEPDTPSPSRPSLDGRSHDTRQPEETETPLDAYADLDLYGEYHS